MNRMVVTLGVFFLLASGCQEYGDASDGGGDAGKCPAVCNGGCSAGVCIIAGSDQEVVCPALMPCRVNCDYGTCDRVDCLLASDCDIRCLGASSCTGPILCGTGACHVECGGSGNGNMCQSSIDCQRSSSCEIGCLGSASCLGPITCGPGRCNVQCGGTGASGMCTDTISCPNSCGCDVVCAGGSSCPAAITCPGRCETWLGCTSTEAGCDSCN